MTHRAQQIVDAVAAALAASSSVGAVFTHRSYSLSEEDQELPATTVNVGEDQPLSELGASNVAFLDSLLTLEVAHLARADSVEQLLTDLIAMRTAGHVALMADRSQGLNFVIDTRYGGAGAPDVDISTGPAGQLVTRWQVHYRMNLTDPS